jgi:hypothetical protein
MDPHASYVKNGEADQTAEVVFSHPRVSDLRGDLVVRVAPNDISWGYGLNTAEFPTYGGEVVQILSMFFDDMTITGDVRSYGDMERIHAWFLTYMQVATQGNTGGGSYDMRPVTFDYPARQWTFAIQPKALPSFKYSRDITVPNWSVVAAVLEPAYELQSLIIDEASLNAFAGEDFDTFGKATAAIGYREDNPWSAPTSQQYKRPDDIKASNAKVGDFFTSLIPAWLSGDFTDLFGENASKPPSELESILKDLGALATKKK